HCGGRVRAREPAQGLCQRPTDRSVKRGREEGGVTQQFVFGITGWKNAGKTTLTERLVAEFARRGWRVATVKHAHHSADIDKPGTDSYPHRAAGAADVALVTGARYANLAEEDDAALREGPW